MTATWNDIRKVLEARLTTTEGWTLSAAHAFIRRLEEDAEAVLRAQEAAPADYSNGHPVHNGRELCDCRLNDPPCRWPNGDVIEDDDDREAERLRLKAAP